VNVDRYLFFSLNDAISTSVLTTLTTEYLGYILVVYFARPIKRHNKTGMALGRAHSNQTSWFGIVEGSRPRRTIPSLR